MVQGPSGEAVRSVSVHGCEDQRETKSALLNKLPKKFPKHSGAHGWLRRCSDWWALPGRPAPLAQGVPMAPSCSCSSPALGSLPWRFGMGTEPAPFQAREWGQHPPHQDPRESNPDELTWWKEPYHWGPVFMPGMQEGVGGWPGVCTGMPTSEISSHPPQPWSGSSCC